MLAPTLLKGLSMKTTRVWGAAVATAALALFAGNSWASYERNLTPGELALMPAFCQDVQTVNGWEQGVRESPRAPYWVSKMGRSFWDMHHYCWAGIAVLRSKAPGLNQNQRDHLVETAIDDYYYVVRRAPAEMALMPELYYLIGDSYKLLRRYGQAIEAFKMARSLKPDYWPAYAGHADILLLSNLRGEARELLQEGLRLVPGEAALQSRLDKLSGSGNDPSTASKTSKSTAVRKPAQGAADGVKATAAKPTAAPQ
jgi:tetratricopeptide (TPR) repeat protein